MMHWNTVSDLLRAILDATMASQIFDSFRLVGGTALSLQIGHRESLDIDLFTDAAYGSIDFNAIKQFFRDNYEYVETTQVGVIGMGVTYYVGHSENEQIKVDVYYAAAAFIRDPIEEDGIRMADIEDIIGMKLDIMGRGGRKKDFWDVHGLHEVYTIAVMIGLYLEKYEYGFSEVEIRQGLVNFSDADGEPDPICLLGKHWELIKLDFVNWVEEE